MNNFKTIQSKLEQFIRKYYTNELIKGVILFFSIGLLYFLLTLLVEHFLWLNTIARSVLFWLFIVVELVLFSKFILMPLAKLFKLKKGIDYKEASLIIGNHFPEVNDKLVNVLQLQQDETKSELLLASIEQKSEELTPIPFKLAINFKKNIKYLKYAAIPLLIIALTVITGKFNWFSDSYERVVNYKTAYEPPAPFQFFVVNQNLQATQNNPFTLVVRTAGEVIPENAQITFNNETYFLKTIGSGDFEFVFEQPKTTTNFTLKANNVTSKPYTLNVVEVPTLLSFDMVLDYPSYLKKRDEVLKSTGNATVPQGTKITWKLKTKATDKVLLYAKDTLSFAKTNATNFVASKRVYNQLNYNLSTSNSHLIDYENLAYTINVVRDQHPELNINSKIDSLDNQTLYFQGKISDDYGLTKLQLVYYPTNNEANKQIENLPISQSNFDKFITAFPNQLNVEEGVSYNLYFQVFDNDVLNNYKNTKSTVFSYRKRTKTEEEQKNLQQQNQTIQDLNKNLEKFYEQQKELKELAKTQKEKAELNFNDKKKLENFIKRQKDQEDMMKQFNKKLKENLEDFQKENKEKDPFKEDVKERLKENEKQLEKDEKLLKELEKLREKLSKEEISEKLEKLAKQNKNQKRSLEQLVEITKRYYITKKLENLANDLEKLAEKQNDLANAKKDENTKEKQDKLNEEFKKFQEEMEQLQKDNKELKNPMRIPQNKSEEENIENAQQEASDKLEQKEQTQNEQEQKESNSKAQKSQKAAAQKMKNMSAKMAKSMESSGEEALQEDVEMLRQILDNLLLFSFNEEELMGNFIDIEVNHNEYASYLKKQKNLRSHFEHIDDSLFALSLRQPKISEKVNKEISEVFFYTDKALAQLAENNIYQGTAAQQYTITHANNLANLLSDALDSMMNSMAMPKPGQGEGGMPMPDIIISQEELNKQMKDGLNKSENGQPKDGEGKKTGEKGKEGEEGKKGDKGKDGENGENGKNGKEGNGEGEGNGKGSQQNGDGFSEDLNGELFKIYQQQQQIREALEKRLEKEGLGQNGDAKRLLKQMEDVELDLINKGFTEQTHSKMMNLQHQLLKLKNATFKQGQEEKRESQSNTNQFNNNTNNQIPTAKQYFNSTEILNKQSLPLQQIYKQKAQDYFKNN